MTSTTDGSSSKHHDKKPPTNPSSHTIRRQPWIGGPGTRLPFVVESFLGWGLAISCLSVACYHYVRQMVTLSTIKQLLLLPAFVSDTASAKQKPTISPSLPLTTHSRREILSKSTLERYQQLVRFLNKLNKGEDWPQDELVRQIRSNLLLRRLVSLVMVKQQQDPIPSTDLLQLLTKLWPQLLVIPTAAPDNATYDYEISVIVPAYRENGPELLGKLQEAHDLITTSHDEDDDKSKLQVVIVHAHCTEMQVFDTTTTETMSKFEIILTKDPGGGRGPCLNRGAELANGRILTFLHADTRLSKGWNEAIVQAFQEDPKVNSCAFSFAIDTDTTTSSTNNQYFPPGIRAVETTANLRSHWFHLPYGDQCLSVKRQVFDYVGGYPNQCLMEDYELVRLLRQRVAVLGEQLKILDQPAKCHVRRWQSFGVLYVTLTNSKLVNLYSRQHMTAEELFAIYYGMAPEGKDDPIPWEVELEEFCKE